MTQSLVHGGLLHGGGRISRRGFLRGVGVLGAGSALLTVSDHTLRAFAAVSGAPAVAIRSVQPTWSAPLTRSSFAKHLGRPFDIQRKLADPVPVQLTRVRDLRSRST